MRTKCIIFIFLAAVSLFSAQIKYKKHTGIIIGNTVNIRNKPNIRSKVIKQLRKGDRVRIISKTNRIHKIGNFKDIWFKIKLQNNKTGYIFGAFIFELDELFKNKFWGYVTFSEWAFGLKFNRDSTFSFYYAGGVKKLTKGKFSIFTNYLILNNFSANFLNKKLYFFRFQGKNYLSRKKVKLSFRFKTIIEKRMNLLYNNYSGVNNYLKRYFNRN